MTIVARVHTDTRLPVSVRVCVCLALGQSIKLITATNVTLWTSSPNKSEFKQRQQPTTKWGKIFFSPLQIGEIIYKVKDWIWIAIELLRIVLWELDCYRFIANRELKFGLLSVSWNFVNSHVSTVHKAEWIPFTCTVFVCHCVRRAFVWRNSMWKSIRKAILNSRII